LRVGELDKKPGDLKPMEAEGMNRTLAGPGLNGRRIFDTHTE